jgi:multisubunit Na+/H+ antiporter MnhG subunit
MKTDKNSGFIPWRISKDQAKDTGMAMVLICLLVTLYYHRSKLLVLPVILLLINMTAPKIYKPAAVIWLGLSNILGTVTSKILLTVLFFTVVTPVGVVRKIMGADAMILKKWKKDKSSVFETRNHEFKPEDIDRPY